MSGNNDISENGGESADDRNGTPSPDAAGPAPERRSWIPGRSRGAIGMIAAAAVIVIAGGASAAVELTGSSAPPKHSAPPPQVVAATPVRTITPTPAKTTATPKPTHKPTPKPSPSPSASTRAAEPTEAPVTYAPPATTYEQPTTSSTYQQNCYAPPHPTCVPSPAPSSLLDDPRITDPSPSWGD